MKTIKGRPFNFHRSGVTLAVLLAAGIPAHVSAATVRGTSDAAVVWVTAPAATPHQADGEMRNRDRTFVPPWIVVPAGGSVRFPNDDAYYHSIYSNSGDDAFDIGYYGTGPGKVVSFAKPGIVDVYCHIHTKMHATIVVVDGPYALPQKRAFAISNVPAGKRVVHGWDPDRGERTQTIDVASDGSDVTLDLP